MLSSVTMRDSTDKNFLSEDFCQKYPLLMKHLEAVLQYNEKVNLTSITGKDTGKVLHIEDSLAVVEEVLTAPEGALADLGSGAGYPGIPLAIASGRQTTLIESNNKKALFLRSFVEAHGLSEQVSIAALRSEELAKERGKQFAVVTARAVAELPILLELAAPLLKEQGHFIALKGRPESEEIARGIIAAEMLGMKQISQREYTLSDKESRRSVFVYQKQGEAKILLPRRPGMAAKRPLS